MAANIDETEDFSNIPLAKPKFLDPIPGEVITAGSSKNSDETPIFSKRKMVLRIPQKYTGEFIHLTVCKNWLVCLLQALQPSTEVTLFRFFLPRAIPPGEISLEKYLVGYKIGKLFLDPTGHHILISLIPKSPGLSADFLYIHGNGPKVRRVEKFKDHEITAVAFNKDYGTESSTGSILLGTSKGLIFETELTLEGDKSSIRKQVYDFGLGRPKYPITGLEFYKLPSTNQYIVIATTPDCIFTFQDTLRADEKSLQPIFSSYINGTQSHGYEMAQTDLNYSVLRFYAAANEKFPSNCGWLNGSGLRHGQVAQGFITDEKFLQFENLIPFNLEQRRHLSYEEKRLNVPKSFVLTQHHVLLMYHDHITGLCLLNQSIVYEEYFPEQMGKLLNILRDPFTGHIYVYTEKMVFNFKIVDEQRNIWQIYLNMGQFEMAEIHTVDNDSLNKVLETKAQKAFEDKNYLEAAKIYAETQSAFEEVCLKFIDFENKRPIITYVKKKLEKLPADADERIMVMVVWLIDLYLTQINYPGRSKAEKQEWQIEYDEFMQNFTVIKCVRANRSSIHDLILQHADMHNLSQFAIANEDYEEVISQHICAEKYQDALFTLQKQKKADLYYKYGPLLMERVPKETVEVLMAQGRKFEISKLIPTLIAVDDDPANIAEVIKYLEYCIYNLGETNQAIHNFILRLYAEHQPAKVIKYLENEGVDITMIHYDIIYALSVCLDFKAKTACVFLYCLQDMWIVAVEMALEFDLKLAKETASKAKDAETKRKLWLKIAHHEINDKYDVKKALDLLKECNLLKIEDLLPFFSDFEKIDDFKEPICESLKEYNEKLQELQHDMNESCNQAERVRSDLQNIRESCIRMDAHDVCNNCDTFLLVKPFFIFGCSHKFHADCLEKLVVPLLNSENSRKLTMLKQQLETMLTQSAAMGENTNAFQTNREKLKQEIEEIIAADCVYCGLMIETIDQPFVEDWDQVNVDWE